MRRLILGQNLLNHMKHRNEVRIKKTKKFGELNKTLDTQTKIAQIYDKNPIKLEKINVKTYTVSFMLLRTLPVTSICPYRENSTIITGYYTMFGWLNLFPAGK